MGQMKRAAMGQLDCFVEAFDMRSCRQSSGMKGYIGPILVTDFYSMSGRFGC